MDAKDLVQDLKQTLIKKYGQDELLDRMILSNLGFDLGFKQRHFPESFKYLAINMIDKTSEVEHDIVKEMEIPSKYVLMNKTNKAVCSVPNEEF